MTLPADLRYFQHIQQSKALEGRGAGISNSGADGCVRRKPFQGVFRRAPVELLEAVKAIAVSQEAQDDADGAARLHSGRVVGQAGAGNAEIPALGAVRVGGADAVIDVEAFLHGFAQAGAFQRLGQPDQDDAISFVAAPVGGLHVERLLHFGRVRLTCGRRSRGEGRRRRRKCLRRDADERGHCGDASTGKGFSKRGFHGFSGRCDCRTFLGQWRLIFKAEPCDSHLAGQPSSPQ